MLFYLSSKGPANRDEETGPLCPVGQGKTRRGNFIIRQKFRERNGRKMTVYENKNVKKRDKLYITIFIFSLVSLCAAIILKVFGVNWFHLNSYSATLFNLELAIKLVILVIQYVLIVGCVTRYEPKTLCLKMIPYIPLTIILYFLPKEVYSILCILILFVTCVSLSPTFSTVTNFIINIIAISALQLTIIWLRLDTVIIAPVFPNSIQLLIMNIDQFIILLLLYYVNRKVR